MRAVVLISFLLVGVCPIGAAEGDTPVSFNCHDPLKSAPAAVKGTLGQFYRTNASAEQLNSATATLRELSSAATACRVQVQVPGISRELTQEWMSLYMWINRIADFMYLNARGHETVNWKDEYADFASLYEFEA
jgi:hypothetical protein